MRKIAHALGAFGAGIVVLARTVAAASDNAQPAGLFDGLPAFLQSGEFMAGVMVGALIVHLVHMLWLVGRKVLMHTFFFGRRTLQLGVVAAILGGLILLV
jgi:hypothetical protein